MAIHFSASADIKGRTRKEILDAIGAVAAPAGYKGEQHSENLYLILLCELSYLEIRFEMDILTLYLQGTPAGAGAHAAGIDFVDAVAKAGNIDFTVEDETGYYTDRDFTALQEKHYYPWLAKVVDFAHKQIAEKVASEIAVAWAPSWFRPEVPHGGILTPMGIFDAKKLAARVKKEGIAPFAQEFYLWNNKERDALFLRNSALFLIWKECYFMPSARSRRDSVINGGILVLLEEAARRDPSLPFPKQAYLDICKLHEREFIDPELRKKAAKSPASLTQAEKAFIEACEEGHQAIDISALPDYTLFSDIGYRKGNVTQLVGSHAITMPGSYMNGYNQEEDAHVFFDALEKNWHGFTVWPERVEGLVQQFDDEFFQGAKEEFRDFDLRGGGKCRAAYMGLNKNGTGYLVRGEVVSPYYVTFFALEFSEKEEKQWAYHILEAISIRELDIIPNADGKK